MTSIRSQHNYNVKSGVVWNTQRGCWVQRLITCSSRWSFLLSKLGFFRMNSFRTLDERGECVQCDKRIWCNRSIRHKVIHLNPHCVSKEVHYFNRDNWNKSVTMEAGGETNPRMRNCPGAGSPKGTESLSRASREGQLSTKLDTGILGMKAQCHNI